MKVDRDFVFLLNAYDIDPGSYTPKVNTMLDFNLWTFNSRVFPGIDPMPVRAGRQGAHPRRQPDDDEPSDPPARPRVRRSPAPTAAGCRRRRAGRKSRPTSRSARCARSSSSPDEPGDWSFHCHKSHHTMNAMGHDVPTMIGVDHSGIAEKINKMVPDYMVMGDKGGSMGGMEMPLPENTLPMMTGEGPFGGVEMGGMFTVVKVRKDQKRGDYTDPGLVQASARHGGPRVDRRAARTGAQLQRGRAVDAGREPAGCRTDRA
jgi:hypothetical protein